MSTRLLALLVSVLGMAALTPAQAFGSTTEGDHRGPTKADYVKDEILVTYKGGLPSRAHRDAVGVEMGLEEVSFEPVSGMVRYRIIDSRSVGDQQRALASRPDVARVNRNWLGDFYFDPNDPYYWTYQWNLRKIDVPEAWDLVTAAGKPGGSTRYVAIVDSGVDLDHEDLGYIYGWNFVSNNSQRGDGCVGTDPNTGITYYGHGTGVAGIAAAFTNNAKGIAGINYAAPILSARISTGCVPNYAAAVDAIYYAVNNGASVITASWGFDVNEVDTAELKDAVTYAWNNKIPVVAASGNENRGDFNHIAPARWYKVITVGGSDKQDQRWFDPNDPQQDRGANYGDPGLDVSAPAASIRYTDSRGLYVTYSGTSFAVPQVAGVIGLLKALYPNISSQSIKERIWNGAEKVSYSYNWQPACGGQSAQLGCGRLNAHDTIE